MPASNAVKSHVEAAPSDDALLQAIARGDRNAMHALYAQHSVRVYRFVLRMVRESAIAEDLVSQVFLDVWRAAGQFEGRAKVSTWLLSIARFKALTALRQRRHESVDQTEVLELPDLSETPDAQFDRQSTGEVLRHCIGKLSAAHREIIELVYFHELSVEEAARVVGIPPATVKTRMFYARKHLADMLATAGIATLAA